MATTKKNPYNNELSNNGHDFLLSQFQALSAHIDTLISSSAMRLSSFLLVWTILVSIYSFLSKISFSVILRLVIFLFLLVIGWYIFGQQIDSSSKIVGYFRIINRIRGFYSENNAIIQKLCYPLPIMDKKPESIKKIFDPGFLIIEILNAAVFAILVDVLLVDILTAIPREHMATRYYTSGIGFSIFIIFQIITVKSNEKKGLKI